MFLLRSNGRCCFVAFSLHEQCPCGTGGLVDDGDGDGDNPGRLALQERSDPSARSGVGGWLPPRDRGGADNQQPTQIPDVWFGQAAPQHRYVWRMAAYRTE